MSWFVVFSWAHHKNMNAPQNHLSDSPSRVPTKGVWKTLVSLWRVLGWFLEIDRYLALLARISTVLYTLTVPLSGGGQKNRRKTPKLFVRFREVDWEAGKRKKKKRTPRLGGKRRIRYLDDLGFNGFDWITKNVNVFFIYIIICYILYNFIVK